MQFSSVCPARQVRRSKVAYSVAKVSAEQVGAGGTKQTLDPPATRFIREASNDAGGSPIQLAADQSRGASQYIGDRLHAGFQPVPVGIAASAVIAHRFHAGDT